jgi:hypothetical protein
MPLEKAPFDKYLSLCLRVVGSIGISRQAGQFIHVPVWMFTIRSSTNSRTIPWEPYSAQVPKWTESFGLLGNLFYIQVGDACGGYLSWGDGFMTVDGTMSLALGEEEADKLWFDVIAHIPLEEVFYLTTTLPILCSEHLCVRMCNLTHLRLFQVDLSTWFIEPDIREPHVFKNLLRSLRFISITEPRLSGGDWNPLTNFLTRRVAVGHQIFFLSLSDYPPMGEDVVENIRRAVEVFEDGECDNGC